MFQLTSKKNSSLFRSRYSVGRSRNHFWNPKIHLLPKDPSMGHTLIH